MADDNTIIEGTVKFRDGKKWKSRWCVMRKLSPVADCVHLQLYRDSRARWRVSGGPGGAGGAGGCKASLSLQQFVGCEAGFTLDKHSNTLALLCRDHAALLAFDTRERLMQWQVKVELHLGASRQHVVVVAPAPAPAPRAPRLPPGPARLHVRGARAALTAGVPPRLLGVWEMPHLRRYGVVEGRFCLEGGSLCGAGAGLHVLVSERARDIARDFDLATAGELSPKRKTSARSQAGSPTSHRAFRPDTRLSELQERCLPPSHLPLAGTEPRRDRHDTARRGLGPSSSAHAGLAAAGGALLARCRSCMSQLGALSRSSTAALTPGASHFSPNWTMDELPSPCVCDPTPPPRPPRAPRGPALPGRAHRATPHDDIQRVGPYENYDVPKLPSTEVDGEYYDTPKRLKECLNDDLFRITKSSTPSALILKKPCGCLLRLGRRRRSAAAVVVECEDSAAACACRRVTDWILPYCGAARGKENLQPLYATVDLSRKTRRTPAALDARLLDAGGGPPANYENLNFALSLEHYENAKDLLQRAGVTQRELDALGARLDPAGGCVCARCGAAGGAGRGAHDDYLMMEPGAAGAAYTPMSPAALTTRDDKAASNPALHAGSPGGAGGAAPGRGEYRKRSSSADSSRFLEDEGGPSRAASACSIETLRELQLAEGDAGAGVAGGAGGVRRAASVPGGAGGCRDSSSSNDSGVSLCSTRPRGLRGPRPRPRRSRSTDPLRDCDVAVPTKSSSAEAEVPVLSGKPLRSVADTHSTSSGTSDMSDYIETLSLCSSHSSTDTPVTMRVVREATSSLRPRSGKEYVQPADPRLGRCTRDPHDPRDPRDPRDPSDPRRY